MRAVTINCESIWPGLTDCVTCFYINSCYSNTSYSSEYWYKLLTNHITCPYISSCYSNTQYKVVNVNTSYLQITSLATISAVAIVTRNI